MDMVDIEIDGQRLEVEQGTMIIEAADQAGIRIPRFCYHRRLSVAANCRMCLVDVEKMSKPLPACATPVTSGMKVFTRSAKAIDAQTSVMEFLLINHPLDCPICDQGGECELQDVALGYGKDVSRYTEGKRVVKDKDIGPLIATDMTRCIHCTRCVRFGQEIAGIREMGATGRGEHTEIGTYLQHSMQSEISGNIIDLCPVGALTSKPFRFQARAWELQAHAAVASHDCIGSNLYIHTLRDQVKRVVPRENEQINDVWISDRDRFSYEALNHEDRLLQPMLKTAGQWQTVSWQAAFEFASSALKKVLADAGPEQLGALISPNATIEEMYLWQKLVRGLGCDNIDHRLRQSDFSDQDQVPAFPGFEQNLDNLGQYDKIFIVGSHLQLEQPILNLRVRSANMAGSDIFSLNPAAFASNLSINTDIVVNPMALVQSLAGIYKAFLQLSALKLDTYEQQLLLDIEPSQVEIDTAQQLQKGERTLFILGALAQSHPQAAQIRYLAQKLAQCNNGEVLLLTEGCNSAGAWLAGAVPHREAGGVKVAKPGLHTVSQYERQLQAYLLFGFEPQLDCTHAALAKKALSEAELVVAFSSFVSPELREQADVILPIVPFAETSGTTVNLMGHWQSFKAATLARGEARPGWKVLRVFANMLDVAGFEYTASDEVLAELQARCQGLLVSSKQASPIPRQLEAKQQVLIRIMHWPIYANDGMVRRAKSLQKTPLCEVAALRLNADMAAQYRLVMGQQIKVEQNGEKIQLPVIIDPDLPNGVVAIAGGLAETAGFGTAYEIIDIQSL